MALTDSLIAAWELDEASGARVDAHDDNDLTDNNTVGSGTGLVHATAADFERDNSEYLSIADNADLSMGDIDFTIEAWVNAESLTTDHQIVSKDARAGNIEYALKSEPTASQRFRMYVSSDGGFGGFAAVIASNFGNPSTATWYQVICWHDAANNLIGICVNDGTPNTAAHTTGVINSTAPFRIGALGNNSEYWDGLIGPVRVWKRMLTSDERTELYNAGAGLAYADFDGGGGGLSIPIAMYHYMHHLKH